MTVTMLGTLLRQFRVAHGEVMKELADAVGVSSAYLSAVEHGKKAASDKLLSGIKLHYQLDEHQTKELDQAAEVSQPSINISLNGAANDERLLALSFARKFQDLGASEKEQLMHLLNGD